MSDHNRVKGISFAEFYTDQNHRKSTYINVSAITKIVDQENTQVPNCWVYGSFAIGASDYITAFHSYDELLSILADVANFTDRLVLEP